VRHQQRACANDKARIDALLMIFHTLRGAARLYAKNIKTVFNVGLYLLLIDQNIAYFTNDLVCAIGDRRRAFLAKHEAVLLYEAAKDIPQLLGHEFRDAVKALGISPEQIFRLNEISSKLNRFWLRNREFLGTIRSALAAHRDHDAVQYTDALDLVKPFEVMARAADLFELLENLVKVITDLASLTTGPAAIIGDMVASRITGQAK
jgi:hypothetical protein